MKYSPCEKNLHIYNYVFHQVHPLKVVRINQGLFEGLVEQRDFQRLNWSGYTLS